MATPDLKPCPFCGSTRVTTYITLEWKARACMECNGRGPHCPIDASEQDMADTWNGRASPAMDAFRSRLPEDEAAAPAPLPANDAGEDDAPYDIRSADAQVLVKLAKAMRRLIAGQGSAESYAEAAAAMDMEPG